MKCSLVTAPTIEPVSLAELKLHLRLDSGSFADNIDESQSLKPDNYAVADNYTTHVGTGIEVLGYEAIVVLNSGTNGGSGTVDCKIQESDSNVDANYTDWSGGAFTQVTEANDNAVQEKAYTGSKQYIRTVAKVLAAPCDFGTTIIRLNPQAAEDDLLNDQIETARGYVEDITRRALLTQTWDYYLDNWPKTNFIKLPFGNLQSNTKATGTITSDGDNVVGGNTVTIDTKVYTFRANPTVEGDVDIGLTAAESLDHLKAAINHTGSPGIDYVCANAHPTVEATTNTDTVQTLESILGGVAGNLIALASNAASYTVSGATLTGGITSARIQYYDVDGIATEIDVTSDYIMEFNGDQCGKIVLPDGVSWPSVTLFPSNPIQIRFVCGWTAAASIPTKIRTAVKMIAAKLYKNTGEDVIGQTIAEDKFFLKLLNSSRLWDEF